MEQAMPLIVGVVCGLLACAPYSVAFAINKKRRDASILPALVAVGVSMVVIAVSVLVGWLLMREALVSFAVALALTFLLGVVVSVIVYGRK